MSICEDEQQLKLRVRQPFRIVSSGKGRCSKSSSQSCANVLINLPDSNAISTQKHCQNYKPKHTHTHMELHLTHVFSMFRTGINIGNKCIGMKN